MRILLSIILISSIIFQCSSQTLERLENRLDTSKIEYIFYENEVKGLPLTKSEPLPDILCRRKVNGVVQTTYFRLYGENDINFLKAEKDMDTLMFSDARLKYLALLDSFPDDTYLMTRIGASFEAEGNDQVALEWYDRALKGNNLAFDTRRRVTNILLKEKETQAEALDHIIKASIMNRNDSLIEHSLIQVAKVNKSKSKYTGWDFKPSAIFSINEDKTKIVADISAYYWKGYALSQAAYLYEPGYKQEVTQRTDEQLTITPYRESLMILYQSIRKKKVKDPMLKTLKRAAKLDLLEEFMIYEIFLPLDAYSYFTLDKEQKDKIYRYVKEAKLCIK